MNLWIYIYIIYIMDSFIYIYIYYGFIYRYDIWKYQRHGWLHVGLLALATFEHPAKGCKRHVLVDRYLGEQSFSRWHDSDTDTFIKAATASGWPWSWRVDMLLNISEFGPAMASAAQKNFSKDYAVHCAYLPVKIISNCIVWWLEWPIWVYYLW